MVQRPYKRTKYTKSDPEVPGDSQRPDRKGNGKQSTGAQSSVAAGGHRVSLEGQKRTLEEGNSGDCSSPVECLPLPWAF